jgi:hypothetical protein
METHKENKPLFAFGKEYWEGLGFRVKVHCIEEMDNNSYHRSTLSLSYFWVLRWTLKRENGEEEEEEDPFIQAHVRSSSVVGGSICRWQCGLFCFLF